MPVAVVKLINTVWFITLSLVSASLYTDDTNAMKRAFDGFIGAHGKQYNSPQEKNSRFQIFVENMRTADARNELERAHGGSALHGVTKYSDLTHEEFKRLLTADISLKRDDMPRVAIPNPPSAVEGLVDWSGIYTTPVKDQGYCGSCWAFSSTEQIESDSIRTLGKGTDFVLSPEQIVECDSKAYGCDGGWTESAYEYVKHCGGLSKEASYPYTSMFGKTGTCESQSLDYAVTVRGYTTLDGEASMAAYVQSTGPLSICLDASNWDSYVSGVISVCGHTVDHCVQAVGVDTSASEPYWKVRNSWGTDWGEAGFTLLLFGKDTCAITTDPTFTVVANV